MTGFLLVGENGSAPLRVVEDSLLDAARFVARPVPACGDARWDDYVFELAGSLEGDGVARLWRGPDEGTILLADERLRSVGEGHGRNCPTITLVEVYASVLRGKPLRLAGPTLGVWARRAYRDTGIIDAQRVRLPPLPPGEEKKVRDCHATVEDVLTVRFMREIAPTPLAYRFLSR